MPKRWKDDVGKDIGGNLYVHRDYETVIPGVAEAKSVALMVTYHVVKWNRLTGAISFIMCPGFNSEHEPVVGRSVVVRDGHLRIVEPPSDPWIYHHKFLMVRDNYQGFSTRESRMRSMAWMSLDGIDFSRIGKKSYWEKEVAWRIK